MGLRDQGSGQDVAVPKPSKLPNEHVFFAGPVLGLHRVDRLM